jgi:hypothetical protein
VPKTSVANNATRRLTMGVMNSLRKLDADWSAPAPAAFAPTGITIWQGSTPKQTLWQQWPHKRISAQSTVVLLSCRIDHRRHEVNLARLASRGSR